MTQEMDKPASELVLLNREQAILAFNRRVLAQASRPDVPLLERLRYITIVSSNLDEFFEVRFADTLEAARANDSEATRTDLAAVASRAHAMIDEQYALFNDVVMPALAQQGIVVINHAERSDAQRLWVAQFFEREVRPLLMPVGLDPSHTVSAGGQQVAQLHRAAGRARRLRARKQHRPSSRCRGCCHGSSVCRPPCARRANKAS